MYVRTVDIYTPAGPPRLHSNYEELLNDIIGARGASSHN